MSDTKDKNALPNPEDLTPEQRANILKALDVFGRFLVEDAKKEDNKFAGGGFVDKAVYAAEVDPRVNLMKQVRAKMEEGGLVDDFENLDEEGQIKYFISLLTPPTDSMQAYMREQLEVDLAKLQKTRAK
jgi:hypothetical protein